MKIAAMLLMTLALVSCTKNSAPTKPPSPPSGIGSEAPEPQESQEPEPFRTLRREAYKRGLHWDIFCNSVGEEERYSGWAAREDSWREQYAEDGAQPWWPLRDSYPTREIAAKHLLKLIQGPPPTPPLRYSEEKKSKRRCLSEVGTNHFYQAAKDCEDCK